MIRHINRNPKPSQYAALARADITALQRGAAFATDKAARLGGAQVQTTIRAKGLGNLARAVGITSSLKRRRKLGANSYGAIFARGGDESLAGGALEAYGRGRRITPQKGEWLWFQTDSIKRKVRLGSSLKRMTPERYRLSGSPLGRLIFRRKSERVAELFVKGVVRNAKGMARRPGARSKAKTTIVVLFIGIRYTTRLKRFDKDSIMRMFGRLVPTYIAEDLAAYLTGR